MARRSGRAASSLPGQAVDEIDVDGAKARVTAIVDHPQSLLHALGPIDRALHVGIEILHTEADAVEAQSRVGRNVSFLDEARIELEREITCGATRKPEVAAQALHYFFQLAQPQEIRCAAAKMHLNRFAVTIEESPELRDFTHQPCSVGATLRGVARDDAVAAAEKAGTGTIGNMQIQREPARNRLRIAAADAIAQVRLAEIGAELRGCGVGRVARSRTIVPSQQVGIEMKDRAHDEKPERVAANTH
jgi:hypothetical protein